MTEGGDPPATRARDLRHEAVDVKPVQEAAGLGTVALRIVAELDGRSRECGAEIAIREAAG